MARVPVNKYVNIYSGGPTLDSIPPVPYVNGDWTKDKLIDIIQEQQIRINDLEHNVKVLSNRLSILEQQEGDALTSYLRG